MSTVASPGRLLAYIGAPPQPFIQRPALAGGFIQRLLAVPTPCRPLERAVPVPCQRASIAAQARARGRAVLGTSTGEAGPGRFRTGPNQHRARAGPMGQACLENFTNGGGASDPRLGPGWGPTFQHATRVVMGPIACPVQSRAGPCSPEGEKQVRL